MILTNPLFWISIYLVGYIISIITISSLKRLKKIQTKFPRSFLKIFILLVFMLPILILPFTKGPQLPISIIPALIIGIILLILNFYIKVIAQKQIGKLPGLKTNGKLITTGIYSIIRNPLYLSNGFLALGLAIIFKSLYAFLFSIVYFLFFLLIIYFEEKDLLKKYGEEYKKYKKKVKYKIIPWII